MLTRPVIGARIVQKPIWTLRLSIDAWSAITAPVNTPTCVFGIVEIDDRRGALGDQIGVALGVALARLRARPCHAPVDLRPGGPALRSARQSMVNRRSPCCTIAPSRKWTPTISVSMRVLTDTLATGVTVPRRSIRTGTFRFSAMAVSIGTTRGRRRRTRRLGDGAVGQERNRVRIQFGRYGQPRRSGPQPNLEPPFVTSCLSRPGVIRPGSLSLVPAPAQSSPLFFLCLTKLLSYLRFVCITVNRKSA